MKSILLLIFTSTFIVSCNFNQKKQEREKMKADSILQVQQLEREKFVADSIEKAALFQLAITAFGDLKFGMKRDTVKSILATILNSNKARTLGAYDYFFTPTFNSSGQLYQIQLKTLPESALQLETTVMARVQNLKQIISKKYGVPQKSFDFPDDFAFVESNIQWTNIWNFDTKTIKIGVEAEPEGSRYNAICLIYDDPLRVKERNKNMDILQTKIVMAASDF